MNPGILSPLILAAAIAAAPAVARAKGTPCPEGHPLVADLGISSIECDCTIQTFAGARPRLWRFRNEPRIRSLREGSSASAVLREGDVITAIDGHLITTREGGRRFANPSVGTPVTLAIRRDGRTISARLAPESVCADETVLGYTPIAPRVQTMLRAPMTLRAVPEPPAPLATPEAPATPAVPPRAPRAPRAMTMPGWRWEGGAALPDRVFEVVPRGWFGMSLNCSDCSLEGGEGDQPPVWTFSSFPEVGMVEPGSPASRGGIRAGDRLTHIDRIALNTDEGGRRFGGVRPGQTVEFTLRRDGAERRLTAVAGTRPEPRAAQMEEVIGRLRELRTLDSERMSAEMARLEAELAMMRARQVSQDKRLRYAGSVGGSDVEVRGLHNVVVDDSGDEIVIITSDARIVIKPSARAGDRKKK